MLSQSCSRAVSPPDWKQGRKLPPYTPGCQGWLGQASLRRWSCTSQTQRVEMVAVVETCYSLLPWVSPAVSVPVDLPFFSSFADAGFDLPLRMGAASTALPGSDVLGSCFAAHLVPPASRPHPVAFWQEPGGGTSSPSLSSAVQHGRGARGSAGTPRLQPFACFWTCRSATRQFSQKTHQKLYYFLAVWVGFGFGLMESRLAAWSILLCFGLARFGYVQSVAACVLVSRGCTETITVAFSSVLPF